MRRKKPKIDPALLAKLEKSNQRCEDLFRRLMRDLHALDKEQARAKRYARKVKKLQELPPRTEIPPPNGQA